MCIKVYINCMTKVKAIKSVIKLYDLHLKLSKSKGGDVQLELNLLSLGPRDRAKL